ncbi:MAG: rhomboid family intramembrane serine protease [Vampirovibrionales bacterium]|nr:rhomboid family intramembrane serine protease [Vampirovibrionales bacterium]
MGNFNRPALLQGQWWRMLTSPMLHLNWQHVLSNAFGLWIFGARIEAIIGAWRAALLYGFSVAFSLIASYLWVPEATIGASGGVYGLLSAYLVFMLVVQLRKGDFKAFLAMLRGLILFAALFVYISFQEAETVNVLGHLGGMIGGAMFALGLCWPFKRLTAR